MLQRQDRKKGKRKGNKGKEQGNDKGEGGKERMRIPFIVWIRLLSFVLLRMGNSSDGHKGPTRISIGTNEESMGLIASMIVDFIVPAIGDHIISPILGTEI